MVQPILAEIKLVETHALGNLKMSFTFRGNMDIKETEHYLELKKKGLRLVINTTGRLTLYITDTRSDTDDISALFAGFDIGDIKHNRDVLKVIARSGHALLYVDIYKSVQAIIDKEKGDQPVFTKEEKRKKEIMERWVAMLSALQKNKKIAEHHRSRLPKGM